MIRRNPIVIVAAFLASLGSLGLAAHAEITGLVPDKILIAVLMLPAWPRAAFSQSLSSEPVRQGLLWGSAHSPAFLNVPGVIVVYLLPAAALAWWAHKRRKDPANGSPK